MMKTRASRAALTALLSLLVLALVGPGIDAPIDLQVCADARSDLSTGPLIPVS